MIDPSVYKLPRLGWRASGSPMLVDMKKFLTNALRDANLRGDKVEHALEWRGEVLGYENRTTPGYFGGSNALDVINPR